MATYTIHFARGSKPVEAKEWRVEGDFVIFYSEAGEKVYATKASGVVAIEKKS